MYHKMTSLNSSISIANRKTIFSNRASVNRIFFLNNNFTSDKIPVGRRICISAQPWHQQTHWSWASISSKQILKVQYSNTWPTSKLSRENGNQKWKRCLLVSRISVVFLSSALKEALVGHRGVELWYKFCIEAFSELFFSFFCTFCTAFVKKKKQQVWATFQKSHYKIGKHLTSWSSLSFSISQVASSLEEPKFMLSKFQIIEKYYKKTWMIWLSETHTRIPTFI